MNETFLKKIDQLVREGDYRHAMEMLDKAILETPTDDSLFMSRGKLHWRLGNRSQATSDYSTAIHLNPDSPARHLLEMAQNVADFFNPDLLNP